MSKFTAIFSNKDSSVVDGVICSKFFAVKKEKWFEVAVIGGGDERVYSVADGLEFERCIIFSDCGKEVYSLRADDKSGLPLPR